MTIRILSWRADSFMHEADDLRRAFAWLEQEHK